MNALFEPSLLFISETDWYDEEKQDAFLEHLINHLELIDDYDMCKIWWTDDLQTILVGNPNMHPWFQSDLRNPLIVKKLISARLESASSDLHDEFIAKKNIKEWRIRVTQRPSSTRIHYLEANNTLTFLCYYGEGEHDVRL